MHSLSAGAGRHPPGAVDLPATVELVVRIDGLPATEADQHRLGPGCHRDDALAGKARSVRRESRQVKLDGLGDASNERPRQLVSGATDLRSLGHTLQRHADDHLDGEAIGAGPAVTDTRMAVEPMRQWRLEHAIERVLHPVGREQMA